MFEIIGIYHKMLILGQDTQAHKQSLGYIDQWS